MSYDEPNTDRYYDIPLHEEEAEHLDDCPCGNEIYEGHSHVIVDGEYFCDSVCVYYHWVKPNFNVEEID
jgi:hypothetical protein